jgi:hypothetical protein
MAMRKSLRIMQDFLIAQGKSQEENGNAQILANHAGVFDRSKKITRRKMVMCKSLRIMQDFLIAQRKSQEENGNAQILANHAGFFDLINEVSLVGTLIQTLQGCKSKQDLANVYLSSM